MNGYIQLIRERGILWFVYRTLYSAKIKILRAVPLFEKIFERKISDVIQINMFDVDVAQLRVLLLTLSSEKRKKLIEEADSACTGKIKGFSSCELDYGWPIDWQLNPSTGKSTDGTKKWYRISDFDSKRGDIKAIWEVSRFSHFFLLARAFILTGDSKYYKAFSLQLSDWLQKNPYSYGANFKCGQECALRMLSCLMVYPIFSKIATEEDVDNIKELVSRCYRKILSNFFYAYKCQNNNHAISELMGMIAGAWCCEEKFRIKKAYKILNKVVDSQFKADGGYIQESFNYQRVALQDMEAVLVMEGQTGRFLSEKVREKILKSVLQMYQCQDESGFMPNYGANDGALIFPVTSCGYRDYTPCINAVYALLRGKRLYNNGVHDEELIWFGVSPNIKQDYIVRQSMSFDETGLYTFRKSRYWMMISAKPKINHMDQNHIDLWIKGINVLCDSGTYSYASDLGRKLFATEGHNTLHCIGKEQINRLGQFAVYGQPKIKKINWSPEKFEDEIEFADGYAHKRIVYLKENGIELVDELVVDDECEAEILFHTACEESMLENKEYLIGGLCKISTDEKIEVKPAKRSIYYMKEEPIRCMVIPIKNKVTTKITIVEKE